MLVSAEILAAGLIRLITSLADQGVVAAALVSAARGMIRLCSDGGSTGLTQRAAVLSEFVQRSDADVALGYCTEAVLRLRDADADDVCFGGFDTE